MKPYEKPFVEIISFSSNEVIMDVEVGEEEPEISIGGGGF